jgi:hypothetical protein
MSNIEGAEGGNFITRSHVKQFFWEFLLFSQDGQSFKLRSERQRERERKKEVCSISKRAFLEVVIRTLENYS